MIPDEIVERVRAEADAVAIIGEFVKLKRAGSSFRGPCPFHGGTHPNFSISAKGGYYCFVCHEKGDVITFIKKRLGLEFVDAVKHVAAHAGIEVREVSRRTAGADVREPMWELNATVAEFYREQLWESSEGRIAREYLASRGIGREEGDRFTLGYSPGGRGVTRAHLAQLGFGDDRQLAAGLLIQSDDNPEIRPRFRNRLIFPISDAGGHIVGFGGRILGEGKPKYLNSAESDVFIKRQLLYGLHWARNAIRRSERVFIVEGYFDTIRLALAGIEEVVAPLGTALTEAQAGLVHKYAKTVYLLYDSDRAGLEATFRAGDALLPTRIAVRVISLPAGDDPDTFAARVGREGLEKAAESSVDLFDRKIQILERMGYFTDLRKKREALDKLLPTIRITGDPITRDLYIARTSEVAGVSRDLLERELATAPAHQLPSRSAADDAPHHGSRPPKERRDQRGRGVRAERELVRTMLHQRRFIESVAERVSGEMFTDRLYRQIFAALISHHADATAEDIAVVLDNEAIDVLQELLEESGGLDRSDETVAGSVNALFARDIDAQLNRIDRELPLAAGERQNALIQEKTRLLGELQGLGRARWKGYNSPR